MRAFADRVDSLRLAHGGVLIEVGGANIVVRSAEGKPQPILALEVLCELQRNLDMKARDDRALIPIADQSLSRHKVTRSK